MLRGISEEVHVRSGVLDGTTDAPVQFVWRGRLYVVREVLSRWRERHASWERPHVLEVGDVEREVFRVHAGVGRGSPGVYDLARRLPAGVVAAGSVPGVVSEVAGSPAPGAQDTWQLLRVRG